MHAFYMQLAASAIAIMAAALNAPGQELPSGGPWVNGGTNSQVINRHGPVRSTAVGRHPPVPAIRRRTSEGDAKNPY